MTNIAAAVIARLQVEEEEDDRRRQGGGEVEEEEAFTTTDAHAECRPENAELVFRRDQGPGQRRH